MEQKIIFRQLLDEIRETAEEKGNVLSVSEVDDFFAHAGLTPEQMELIYAYLEEQRIKVTGRTPSGAGAGTGTGVPAGDEPAAQGTQGEEAAAQTGAGSGEEEADGIPESLSIYLDELDALEDSAEDDAKGELALFERAAAGDTEAAKALSQRYLSSVVEMAAQYPDSEARPEDLIGEGNLALVSALSKLEPQADLAAYRRVLLSEIGSALEACAGGEKDADDKGRGLVTKVERLAGAARSLEKELGHPVSAEELSAYLDMPVEEIRDILRIAGDSPDLP